MQPNTKLPLGKQMSGIEVHVHFTFITPGQEWLWIEAFKAPIGMC